MKKRLDEASDDKLDGIASKFRDEQKKLGNEMESISVAETRVESRERWVKRVPRHEVRKIEADDLN
jgi:hypothetical protein